jgi:DNA primase
VDVIDLLQKLGIEGQEIKGGTEYRARCPNHEEHQNGDKHPSWSIVIDPDHERYGLHHCWSCKFGGGPYNLAAHIWKCSVKEASEKLHDPTKVIEPPELIDIPKFKNGTSIVKSIFKLPDGVIVPNSVEEFPSIYRYYLKWRGIHDQSITKWGIGYAEQGKLARRIVFPVYTNGILTAYSAREVDFTPWIRDRANELKLNLILEKDSPFERYIRAVDLIYKKRPSQMINIIKEWISGPPPSRYLYNKIDYRYMTPSAEKDGSTVNSSLYGYDFIFPSNGPVTIVEGCMKAIIMDQYGWPNPIAIFGSSLTEERMVMLSHMDIIYCGFDPDPSGKTAWEQMAPDPNSTKYTSSDQILTLQGLTKLINLNLPVPPDKLSPKDNILIRKKYLGY